MDDRKAGLQTWGRVSASRICTTRCRGVLAQQRFHRRVRWTSGAPVLPPTIRRSVAHRSKGCDDSNRTGFSNWHRATRPRHDESGFALRACCSRHSGVPKAGREDEFVGGAALGNSLAIRFGRRRRACRASRYPSGRRSARAISMRQMRYPANTDVSLPFQNHQPT